MSRQGDMQAHDPASGSGSGNQGRLASRRLGHAPDQS